MSKRKILQSDIVAVFFPQFAPHAKQLPATPSKRSNLLKQLGIEITGRERLPDLVFYSTKQKCLYFLTIHKPISNQEYQDWESLFKTSKFHREYISAFTSFAEYERYAQDIAWNTHVWIAEVPDHMIHHNGDQFLARRRKPKGKSL